MGGDNNLIRPTIIVALSAKKPVDKNQRVQTLDGAEGETRTRTSNCPPPPQDGVSTNSTTSAKSPLLIMEGALSVNKKFATILRRRQRAEPPAGTGQLPVPRLLTA